MNRAGVKIVSDYVDNYKRGLPSEMAVLNLFDPANGMPLAVLDAAGITDMRTGAMTAVGAKYLARKARACWAISARAARPIGMCACSIICSISTKSASTPAARRARTPSPRG